MYCDIPKLSRCCFCMPLRRGLLTFGYVCLLSSTIALILYTTELPVDVQMISIAYDDFYDVDLSIAIYSIDIVFSLLLIYGAHKQSVSCIKGYYYYTLTSICAMSCLSVYYMIARPHYLLEDLILTLLRICFFVYLFILIRSLMEKLENTSVLSYENQLQEIVEIKQDNVTNPSVPNDTV